jgi:transcriptional regulator with XRE-family HTH domain
MPGETDLGLLLRRHRNASGLTQEELAERAGISARTVSDVERGLRTLIYRDTAARIADALDLGLDERIRFEAAARRRARPLTMSKSAALPRPITALLGRERELELITSALIDDGVRLLTLTGPGGVEDRLAVEAAHRIGQYSAADAVFVSLGAITDPALVPSAVATAAGCGSRVSRSARRCRYICPIAAWSWCSTPSSTSWRPRHSSPIFWAAAPICRSWSRAGPHFASAVNTNCP